MRKTSSIFIPEDTSVFEDQQNLAFPPAEADQFLSSSKKTFSVEKQRSQSAISRVIKDQQADPLFTPEEASEYIGAGKHTLAVWRCTGRYNLPFVKVGRLVKYRKSALDAFLESRTCSGNG